MATKFIDFQANLAKIRQDQREGSGCPLKNLDTVHQ